MAYLTSSHLRLRNILHRFSVRIPSLVVNLLITSFFCISLPLSAWATVGASRSYDAVNDEVDWGANVDVTTNDVSYCTWVKPTEDDSSDYWIGKGSSSGGGTGYGLLTMITTDASRCGVGDGTTNQAATGNDIDGVWTFVCCVWDSTNDDLFLYENNTNVASDTADTLGSITTTSSLQSGETNGNSDDASGLVAYASIFLSKQLTAVEMAEIYWKPEGMVDSLSFMAPLQATATTEPDWSAGKLGGTVSGSDTGSNDGPPVLFGLGLPL